MRSVGKGADREGPAVQPGERRRELAVVGGASLGPRNEIMRARTQGTTPRAVELEAVPEIDLGLVIGVRVKQIGARRAPQADVGAAVVEVQIGLGRAVAVARRHATINIVRGERDAAPEIEVVCEPDSPRARDAQGTANQAGGQKYRVCGP